jgi:hypothetical protein
VEQTTWRGTTTRGKATTARKVRAPAASWPFPQHSYTPWWSFGERHTPTRAPERHVAGPGPGLGQGSSVTTAILGDGLGATLPSSATVSGRRLAIQAIETMYDDARSLSPRVGVSIPMPMSERARAAACESVRDTCRGLASAWRETCGACPAAPANPHPACLFQLVRATMMHDIDVHIRAI